MSKHIAVKLLEEKLIVYGNMVKLDKFLAEPENTREIEPREVGLLHDQLKAMKEYYGCLNLRSYYHANNNTWPDIVAGLGEKEPKSYYNWFDA